MDSRAKVGDNKVPHIEADRAAAETAGPDPDPNTDKDGAMAPAKRTTSPAFQFYPKDFISSSAVQQMSMTERGIYITLLSHCWLDGGVPSDMKALARLVGIKQSRFERIWSGPLSGRFTNRGEVLVNPRLEEERRKQLEYRRRQADNGKKGGRRSGLSDGKGLGSASPSTRDWRLKISSPSLEEKKGDASEFDGQAAFARLAEAYPQHRTQRGQRTQVAFLEAMGDARDWAETSVRMLAQLEQHKRSHEWRTKPSYIPGLERWLTEGLWLRTLPETDEAAPAKPDPYARLRERMKATGTEGQ